MIGRKRNAPPERAEAYSPPPRRGFFGILLGPVILGIVGLIAWQIVAPEGSRPSQLMGEAIYDIFYEPATRAETRLAEIDRCTQIVESIKERQLAHSERVGSTAQISVFGSVGLAVVYDAMGDQAAALFPRKTALDELNAAERLSLLEEYVRLMENGRIFPQGAC